MLGFISALAFIFALLLPLRVLTRAHAREGHVGRREHHRRPVEAPHDQVVQAEEGVFPTSMKEMENTRIRTWFHLSRRSVQGS